MVKENVQPLRAFSASPDFPEQSEAKATDTQLQGGMHGKGQPGGRAQCRVNAAGLQSLRVGPREQASMPLPCRGRRPLGVSHLPSLESLK